MLTNSNNPLADRKKLCSSSLFLVRAVVGHDTAASVKCFLGEENLRFLFHEVVVGIFVCNHVDRVLQDGLNRKAGEVLSLLGFDSLPQQLCFHSGQRIRFYIEVKNHFRNLDFLGNRDQLVGFSFFAVNGDLTDGTGLEAGRRIAAQPAASLCQFVHIIPDTLSNGFTLQLGEHGDNKHHGSAHRGAGVELLLNGYEGYIQLGQFIDQPRKIADITADSVQAIDYNCLEFALTHFLHHPFEVRSLQITAGESLVLKHNTAIHIFLAEHIADILFTEFHLIADTFTLAGELGFTGVYGNLFFISTHILFLPLDM